MKKISLRLLLICILWTIYHWVFFHLNDVMKIADSFAYMQMSYFINSFSSEWLWNGWFGFTYSGAISLWSMLFSDLFFSAKIINLVLLNISAILLWNIWKHVLSQNYNILLVVLFFLSPTLLHFNIHILSENIYIPIFLYLFLLTHDFINKAEWETVFFRIKNVVLIACCIWLMYLTRAEAFIYILSVWIISWVLLIQNKLNLKNFLWLWSLFFVTFFIFISPYLLHLNSLTWEWGMTNKWASNLRQAELRGQEKMDDSGFEQAVAELTPDNKNIIAGFAWWMPYSKPNIEGSLTTFISKDPLGFGNRFLTNQVKLFSKNFPEIFLWKSPDLYYWDDARFSHFLFFIWSLLPISILVYGLIQIYKKQKTFFLNSLAFFIPAALFFTLFFTLNRYFLIFLPLLLVAFCFWIQCINIWTRKTLIQRFFIWNFISILLLSTLVYYNIEKPKDEYYSLKQEAGQWLLNFCSQEIINPYCSIQKWENTVSIMERFPIVTYYSGSKTRYITPFTDNIQDIYEYGVYNNIDILVVDTMDFQTYRPQLTQYLETTPKNFIKLQEFKNTQNQKVILYALKK